MNSIYLMRHSMPLKHNNINNSDSLQLQNEKWCLTIKGEKLAFDISKISEFKNFDIVISSNYVRAVATAKYFANDIINIDESFGERKFGIDSWDQLPYNFEVKQFNDYNYKLPNGESLNEVLERETKALNNILNKYNNKKILIVSHATAIGVLLTKWCSINDKGYYLYKDKVIFDGKFNFCETFKLEFNDNNELVDIENIRNNCNKERK